jgi:DNA-binding MarR family transcriptional regulator
MPKDTPVAELRDPLEDMLGYQLRRASQATLSALSEAFEEQGVTITEAIIIRLVRANPGCNQAEIGRTLGVRRTNMVPIVAGLVDRELLRREAADGRTNALFLTPSGLALHDRIEAASLALERHYFGDIDPDTRRIVLDVLLRVRKKGTVATAEEI